MPYIELTIAEIMDATLEADEESKPVLAALELRLRMLRKRVYILDLN